MPPFARTSRSPSRASGVGRQTMAPATIGQRTLRLASLMILALVLNAAPLFGALHQAGALYDSREALGLVRALQVFPFQQSLHSLQASRGRDAETEQQDNKQTPSLHERSSREARAPNLSHQIESPYAIRGNLVASQWLSSHQNQQPKQMNDQPLVLDQCCACDEAKYELVFEGLWSRHTHPENFPDNNWSAFFSDIIGASHSNEFRMWEEGAYASEGVKELAELGSTKKLESELKQVSSKTRTIIKARELRAPTLNTKTSAVFRTDRHHHLVSILSKLGPSPDWMVGVSGLELCLADCSWVGQRIINLHLWDAGTDSGATFSAPDQPSQPQERIHLFRKSSFGSNDTASQHAVSQQQPPPSELYGSNSNYEASRISQSNFSIEQALPPAGGATASSGEQTKPFARLTITRQRIYEKSCNSDSVGPSIKQISSSSSSIAPVNTASTDFLWTEPPRNPLADCRFTEWSDWSTCSSTCGKGIRTRTRSFVDEQAQLAGCSQIDLIDKEVCLSECIANSSCVTRDWSEWSKCSVTCGQGYRKRTRTPIGVFRRACEALELAEVEPCTGPHGANCSSDPSPCALTNWSNWSECSVACGKGTRIRTRHYTRKEDIEQCNAKLVQKQPCSGRQERCSGAQGAIENAPETNPNLPVIDCKLSAWGPWSTCSALCGNGKRIRSRYIIQMPQNGGKPCDKKLSRTQKCKDLPPCPPNYINYSPSLQAHQAPFLGKGGGTKHRYGDPQLYDLRTSSTTSSSSMTDDEDDSKFSRLIQSPRPGVSQSAASFTANTGQHDLQPEMRLIGSSSFHIKDGFVYLVSSDNKTLGHLL